MEKAEFEAKAKEAMSGPANFDRLWKMLEESNAGTMEMKLFQKEGDEDPFRAIILVSGKREVREVLELLDKRHDK